MADYPTYQEKCAEACKWCRQGRGKSYMDTSHRDAYETELRAEITKLRSVCGEAYQFAGSVNAPENVLDNLSAASHGMPLRHAAFLPVSDALDGRKEGTE